MAHAEDIRSARPYLFTRSPLKTLSRRVASIAALVVIDLAGLVIGVYAALVLRSLIRDPKPILWNLLWQHEADWLPFLILLMLLVFSRNGLYGERELLEIVEAAHRRGVKVRVAPRTTELLVERGEYVPGQGVPLFELRPPILAGTDWALKRTFDIAVAGAIVVVGLPVWMVIAAL